jgi:glycine/D-amino acid oxidase-like deaminating enzyme
VRGIRLTTGIEFALPDAPRTPVQLGAVEPLARSLFPLANRLDPEPWMGLRPCTPDMMPVIAPRRGMPACGSHSAMRITDDSGTGHRSRDRRDDDRRNTVR